MANENKMTIAISNGQELNYDMETVVALCLTHNITPDELPSFILGQVQQQVNEQLAPINDLITRRVVSEFMVKATVKDNGATVSFEYDIGQEGLESNQEAYDKVRDVLTINGSRNVTAPKSYGKRTKAERYLGSRIARESKAGSEYLYEEWTKWANSVSGQVHWSAAKNLMRTHGAKTHSDVAEAYGYLLETGKVTTVNMTHREKAPDGLTGEYLRFC